MFCDRGQVLADTHKAISLRVTPQTYERALAVLNSVCWEAEKRGFSAALRDSGDRIQLTGHGAEIKLRLSEKTTDEWRTERRDWSDKPEHVKFKKPTGKLRLYIQGVSYSEVDVSDDKDQPLEKKLNEIFQRLYRQVVRCWQETRRRAEWDRQWREESDRRRAEEQRRQEEARLREADRNRRKELVDEANAWRSASLIRNYVAHVEEAVALLGENHRPGEIREWSSWALAVAEELDPTSPRAGLGNGMR